MNLSRGWALLTAAVALIGSPGVLRADTLGVASGYNLFTFGDFDRYNADIEGRGAVGGNSTLTMFNVNPNNVPGPALVVGGNLNFTNGQVSNGSTFVGGTATTSSFGSPNGTVTQNLGTNLPVDFAAAYTDLTARSAAWGQLAANGTAANNFGTLTLTANESATTNVFSLTGAQLQGLNGLNIVGGTGETVLVNVFGNPGTFTNFQMFRNGNAPVDTKVLWNFVDATAITMTNFSFRGSVLAPFADLQLSGNIEGNTIVKRVLNGPGGEFHNYLFTGELPEPPGGGGPPPAVPAPAGLVLAGIGALGCLGFARRK